MNHGGSRTVHWPETRLKVGDHDLTEYIISHLIPKNSL